MVHYLFTEGESVVKDGPVVKLHCCAGSAFSYLVQLNNFSEPNGKSLSWKGESGELLQYILETVIYIREGTRGVLEH